jgi:steroid delta-isomerase-like uncharacterized protein
VPIEENKAIAQAILDMFVGKMSLDRAGDYIAANSIDHQGIPGVDTNGVEGFKRVVTIYHGAFPDMTMVNDFVVAEGDKVVAHFKATGTNTGDFAGMPATGKSIDIEGVDVMRIADGKAVEHWGYFEEQKMMEQLGLMPEQPSA